MKQWHSKELRVFYRDRGPRGMSGGRGGLIWAPGNLWSLVLVVVVLLYFLTMTNTIQLYYLPIPESISFSEPLSCRPREPRSNTECLFRPNTIEAYN